ncbi:replicative DNA helicase [Candidatus Fermentibacteria bacterium]|nr:MAG: replicative DNA helicase [Candidatus Fermentibacteria bacterium]
MSTTHADNGHTASAYEQEQEAVRLPPHNTEAEEALLGAVFVDPDRLPELKVQTKMFYRVLNRKIYSAFKQLYAKKKDIDFITVSDILRAGGIEEEPYLIGLLGIVPTSVHIHSYAAIVIETYNRRRMISLAGTIANKAWDEEGEFEDVITTALEGTRNVSGESGDDDPVTSYDAGMAVLDHLSNRRSDPNARRRDIVTGFKDLDRLLVGIEPGSFVVSAGRPGMGKSLFEQMIAYYVAKMGKRVARFNLEMSVTQMMVRAISSTTQVPYKTILNPHAVPDNTWTAINGAIGTISELPIFMDDTASLTMSGLESKLYKLVADHGHIPFVTVDYLQLMSGDKGNRKRIEEISDISRRMKILAKDLDTVIWANAQLSRSVEMRQNKRPVLSDLRDSGTIEQDADIVIFIYRDEYYREDTERPNIAEIEVAKNRNAATGRIDLYFSGEKMRFADLAIGEPIDF